MPASLISLFVEHQGRQTISGFWFFDGVSLFKHLKTSPWPLLNCDQHSQLIFMFFIWKLTDYQWRRWLAAAQCSFSGFSPSRMGRFPAALPPPRVFLGIALLESSPLFAEECHSEWLHNRLRSSICHFTVLHPPTPSSWCRRRQIDVTP